MIYLDDEYTEYKNLKSFKILLAQTLMPVQNRKLYMTAKQNKPDLCGFQG